MKCMIVSAAYPPDIIGGAEISTELLARALKDKGNEVCVLTIGKQPNHREENGIAVQRIKSPNIYWSIDTHPSAIKKIIWHGLENYNPFCQNQLEHILSHTNPDIVITSTNDNFGANIWRAARKLKIPTVHILRNYNVMCTRAAMHKKGKNCAELCLECKALTIGKKQASNHVDGIIGLSRYILDSHIHNGYFRNAQQIILPNFIPQSEIEKTSMARASMRENAPIFGFLGRLSEYKGVSLVVDAFKKTADKTKARLVIAGSGDADYVTKIKESLAGYKYEFYGWANQHEILNKIDYLIVPSIWNEPLGRVVLESFTCAVPVIGSNRGGYRK